MRKFPVAHALPVESEAETQIWTVAASKKSGERQKNDIICFRVNMMAVSSDEQHT